MASFNDVFIPIGTWAYQHRAEDDTARKWEKRGKLTVPTIRTADGHVLVARRSASPDERTAEACAKLYPNERPGLRLWAPTCWTPGLWPSPADIAHAARHV